MIIMKVEADNLCCFRNFKVDFSYPKKIVNSNIENECLVDRPKFRYKKLVLITGTNASGKTSLSKIILAFFNFVESNNTSLLFDLVNDERKDASLVVEFVVDNVMYRVGIKVLADKSLRYRVLVSLNKANILTNDTYLDVVEKLDKQEVSYDYNYLTVLEDLKLSSWFFINGAFDFESTLTKNLDSDKFISVLNQIIKSFDSAIDKVEYIDKEDSSFVVKFLDGNNVIFQNGKIISKDILSSGTKSSIGASITLTKMLTQNFGLYFVDELFSYVQSDLEKALLSMMVEALSDNEQLFFTTHNTDLFDLDYPKHSFMFMVKNVNDEEEPIKMISASNYLKKNTDSVRNAVNNDKFRTQPDLSSIYNLGDLF